MFPKIKRPIMTLIIIMSVIVAISLLIAILYYNSANNAVDPRVVEARRLYSEYNSYAKSGDFTEIFWLLDTIESIYDSYPHYSYSYEKGVILNNRAAALLTLALYRDSIRVDLNPYFNIPVDSINLLASTNLVIAVNLYTDWKTKFRGMSAEEISAEIEDDFFDGFEDMPAEKGFRYLNNRAKEISNSLSETDRRLSVCYTNLGVLSRQSGEYDLAIKYYREALELWDRNLSAENNLNAIFGKPSRQRNILQRLFPPERHE